MTNAETRVTALDYTHKKVFAKGQKALDEEIEHHEETLQTLKAIHHATEGIVEQLAMLALHEPRAQVVAPLTELPALDAQKPTAPSDDDVVAAEVAARLPELPALDAPRPAEPAAVEDEDEAKAVVMDKPQRAALLAATAGEQSRTTPAEPAVLRASSRPAPPPPGRPSQSTLSGLAPPSSGHVMLPVAAAFMERDAPCAPPRQQSAGVVMLPIVIAL